ncbi:MAG TPA: tetratricopeptide repeat protein, partial [Nannocystaceae bacterium]|nr:tetratricopeptide repeat protein [Nannocystaceae bacterium]
LGARRRRDDIRARLFASAAAPEHIGRYEVLGRLGVGAIGAVYLCRDARLDRRIAVKVLRDPAADTARLRREAQAMARLSHPNVASVFEVGSHEDRVYVAMELVIGVTLREWQAGRTPVEVLDAYEQAGRGLAAAHRVGIVHRDFKPDNAMMGRDGRVRVLDFGLASGSTADERMSSVPPLDASAFAATLTGTTMGTPAYMPPEQLRSADVDARADQFAFCVALWEALFGERPFAATSLAELVDAIATLRARSSADRRVSARMRAVLVRGLAAAPERRFPDMEALLAALARARRSRARPAIFVAGLLAMATLLAWRSSAATDDCARAHEQLDEIWSPAIARTMRAELITAGTPQAAASERIDEIDRRATAWRAEATALCRAPTDDVEIRRACLVDVRESIDAAIDSVRSQAQPPVGGSLSLARCREIRQSGGVPLTVASADSTEVAAIQQAITRTIDAGLAGDYAAAEDAIEPAVARARAIGEPVLLARALQLAGSVAQEEGEYARAERSFTEAYAVALAAGHDRLALRAAGALVENVGYSQRRREDGERWARDGEAIVARLPEDDQAVPGFFVNRGLMRIEHGELDAARADLERAVRIYVDALGPDATEQLPALDNLAHVAVEAGDLDGARTLVDRAVGLTRRARGSDHPSLVAMLSNRSVIAIRQERFDDALADLRDALVIADRRGLALEGSTAHGNLGEVHYQQGRFADAQRETEQQLAQLQTLVDRDHPRIIQCQLRLARILAATGEHARARLVLQDTVARAEMRLGAEAIEVAEARVELAGLDLHERRIDGAAREIARALPAIERESPPCLVALAQARLVEIAIARRERVEPPLAAALEQAQACPALVLADVELALAHLGAVTGDDEIDVRRLATSARDRWRARGGGWDRRAQAVDEWLVTR